jgi:hypothetical protein
MNTIKIALATEQGFSMTYYLSRKELCELKSLIQTKGNAIISDKTLSVTDDYLLHYKNGKDFKEAFYAIPIEGVFEIITEKLAQYDHE